MPLRTPEFWKTRGILSTLLRPFSFLYAKGAVRRQQNATPLKIKPRVLCIGNLVAGGAGKTPIARAIGEWATLNGFKACFLSRGYGGRLSGVWVDVAHHTHTDVGDEPLLLVRTLPTLVCSDRAIGGKMAEDAGYNLVILDDGYQDPSLHKDASLVVVDAEYGFGNGFCLPAGPLREPVEFGLKRAGGVLLTHRAGAHSRQTPSLPGKLPVLHVHLASHFSDMVKYVKLVAFTGIGRPESFFATLTAAGAQLVHESGFADHHSFQEAELQHLAGLALKAEARLITTAKDAVRLSPHWQSQVIIADLHATWDKKDGVDDLLSQLLKQG